MDRYIDAQRWLEQFDWDDTEDSEKYLGDICEALQEYGKTKDAEQQGKLLILPCKPWDTVYILAGRYGNYYEKDICDGFYMGENMVLQIKVKNQKGNHGTYGVLGKTVFLTEPEAEKALEGMKE